jgi:hypothetical protein
MMMRVQGQGCPATAPASTDDPGVSKDEDLVSVVVVDVVFFVFVFPVREKVSVLLLREVVSCFLMQPLLLLSDPPADAADANANAAPVRDEDKDEEDAGAGFVATLLPVTTSSPSSRS